MISETLVRSCTAMKPTTEVFLIIATTWDIYISKASRTACGKRIFLMSPIHHHFEKKGYSETQIVSMYAGVTLILSIIAVLSCLATVL